MESPFDNIVNCCGCGACASACTHKAISLIANAQGFVYPVIDKDKCIDCGLCRKVCGYGKTELLHREKQTCYGGIDCSIEKSQSSSGGIANVISQWIIKNGGVVYGCALENSEELLVPRHIRVQKEKDLRKLQGSKYVQSDIGETYIQAKKDLKNGLLVLFTGTPCQIAGLYSYLRHSYDNLFTIDVICHGVPSKQLFQDSVKKFEKENRGKVKSLLFRDKSNFPALNQKIIYNQKINVRYYTDSTYYTCFLRGDIYRDCCYSCPYAKQQRVGDISLGDFWGIEKTNPEEIRQNGGPIDPKQGVSCVLVNSDQGELLFEKVKNNLYLFNSDIESISLNNHQLNHPSNEPSCRGHILQQYEKHGYDGFLYAVHNAYKWPDRIAKTKRFIKRLLCIK